MKRGKQRRRVGGGSRKQGLEGRGEQNLTAVSINKEVMSSQEIGTEDGKRDRGQKKRKGENVSTKTDRTIADSPSGERSAIGGAEERAGRGSR